MNLQQLHEIIADVSFRNFVFSLEEREGGFLLQVSFPAIDVVTGEPDIQKCRKWYISRHATEAEVVKTCLLAVIQAMEHEVREEFKYKGKAIFNPHTSLHALYYACDMLEYRKPHPEEHEELF